MLVIWWVVKMIETLRVLSNDPGHKNWGWCLCLVKIVDGVCVSIEVEAAGVVELYDNKYVPEQEKADQLANFFQQKFAESWIDLVILEQQFQNGKMVYATFESLKLSYYAGGVLGALKKKFVFENANKSKKFLEIRGGYQEKKKKIENLFADHRNKMGITLKVFHHAADAIGLVYSYYKFRPNSENK
jgi:hypothetical protein